MAIHDYVIDNQSASAFRSDLNNALLAVVTQNSNATAPTTTYANMIWYDTTANQLKKRNEANSAWIILGTIDEGLSTFTPSGAPPSQIQGTWDTGTSTTESLISPAKLDAKVRSELNASGSAPVYACRAWVNFNGTGTLAIRASGNVSSITDNGTGDYTVNFTTAMQDANYAVLRSLDFDSTSGSTLVVASEIISIATGSVRLTSESTNGTRFDALRVDVAIFR
jgi:hypothetical protein